MQSNIANTISRRQFLRGRVTKGKQPVRPPWALPENEFINACSKCNKCIEKCPEGIIVKSDDGKPGIRFELGGCTFCQDCVSACEDSALTITESGQSPWKLRAAISTACISLQGVTCRSCADSCDEQVISFRYQVGGISHPQLDTKSCTGCGFCLSTCPVKAIKISEENESEAYEYGNN